MAQAYVQCLGTISAKTHSQNTVLLPPVRHHYSSSPEQWDAQKEREKVRDAASSCARQCQAEILEPSGHPEGGETCPV